LKANPVVEDLGCGGKPAGLVVGHGPSAESDQVRAAGQFTDE
jgi:hypothetical protein